MVTVVSLMRMQRRAQWAATLVVCLAPPALWWLGPMVMTQGLIAPPWDKLLHLFAFAVLALSLGLASRCRGGWVVALAFVGAATVGALDEWRQMGYAGRTADWADFAANAFGAALGCLAFWALGQVRDRWAEHAGRHGMS